MADDIIQVGEKIPEVLSVQTRKPYTLIIAFRDGAHRELSFQPEELTGVFEPMRDPQFFSRAFVDPETKTVAWPNGVDLDPCVLYEPSLREMEKQTSP